MENNNMEDTNDTFDIDRLQKLAGAGDTDAQRNIGNCYYNGEGVEQDYGIAELNRLNGLMNE